MTQKIKVLAEYTASVTFDADGTETLEQLEDTAWEMFNLIEHSELDWDVVVSRYDANKAH
jgi:hypothetical protein